MIELGASTLTVTTFSPKGGMVSAYNDTFRVVPKGNTAVTTSARIVSKAPSENVHHTLSDVPTPQRPKQVTTPSSVSPNEVLAKNIKNTTGNTVHEKVATGKFAPESFVPRNPPGAVCFTAGTQVVIGMEYDADGNFVQYVTVNIEDIQVGDLVYSYDTATGEVSQKAVTSTSALRSDHINLLTFVDEDGVEQTIETTDTHPFWVVTDSPDLDRAARSVVDESGVLLYHENLEPGLGGFWVEAKDLRVGDVFLGANGELSMLINAVRVEQEGGIAVFNFTVEENHNYFILAKEYEYGQTCVLVHNGTHCHPEHHSIPEFLAGNHKQSKITLELKKHQDFHSLLSKNLKKNGLLSGYAKKDEWIQLFKNDPTAQRRAYDILFDTSRQFDVKYGTEITQNLWKNFIDKNFKWII